MHAIILSLFYLIGYIYGYNNNTWYDQNSCSQYKLLTHGASIFGVMSDFERIPKSSYFMNTGFGSIDAFNTIYQKFPETKYICFRPWRIHCKDI